MYVTVYDYRVTDDVIDDVIVRNVTSHEAIVYSCGVPLFNSGKLHVLFLFMRFELGV